MKALYGLVFALALMCALVSRADEEDVTIEEGKRAGEEEVGEETSDTYMKALEEVDALLSHEVWVEVDLIGTRREGYKTAETLLVYRDDQSQNAARHAQSEEAPRGQ